MDTQDELKFVEYIKSKGLLIFLKEDGKRLKEIDKLSEFKDTWCYGVWLYKEDFGLIDSHNVDTGFLCITDRSYTIEFRRTSIDDEEKVVRGGRIWYQTSYYDENGELIKKGGEIEKVYQQLCRYIRNNLCKIVKMIETPRGQCKRIYYCSKSIKSLYESGYKLLY